LIEDKSVLAIIPARGGSRGLPGKNVADVGGRPLIAWTIKAAWDSQYIDRTILSSDDPEIIAAAEAVGCEIPFVRPAHLATDEASVEETILHALDSLDKEYDLLVLLQPTSPLRIGRDIDACLELCLENGMASAVTVVEVAKSPYWMFHIDPDGHMDRILPYPEDGHRRQNLPVSYVLNGAVYVAEIQRFRENKIFVNAQSVAHIMPPERSIDIDTPLDLIIIRALIAQGEVPENGVKERSPL